MKAKMVIVIFMAFFVLLTPDADSKMGGPGMHEGQYMHEVMGMLKETMGILKGLNHKPTADEKKRLGEMINKLDGLTSKHNKMMKNR